jgi:DNA-binding transcriptional LysR family regulator
VSQVERLFVVTANEFEEGVDFIDAHDHHQRLLDFGIAIRSLVDRRFLEIEVKRDIAVQQYENLRGRKAELVLGRLNEKSEPDLVTEPLFDEPLIVAAGTESRWAKRRNLTLADLIGEPWVFASSGSLARSLADEVFRRSGLETPSAKVLTVSLHLYLRLMETGDWLGLIPASTMRFRGSFRRIKTLPIETSCPPSPVGVVTVKGRTLTPLAQRFIEYTHKIAKEASK